jgi:hypothetical protein
MNVRAIAAAMSAGRLAVGIAMLVAPNRAAGGWIGSAAGHPAFAPIVRALGTREVAMGTGTLLALKHGRGARGWTEAAALADAGDAVATLLAWRHLPERGRTIVLAAASSAAVTNAVLARRIEDEVALDTGEEDPAWRPHAPGHHASA